MINTLKIPATILLLCLILISSEKTLLADQIYMKNGDRITGQIINETELAVTIESEIVGEVIINKDFVERIEKHQKVEQAEVKQDEKKSSLWNNEIALGYTQAGGNTQNASGSAQLLINRKTFDDEWTIKTAGYYGSSSGELNEQKYSGLIRYAFSFGQRKWYNFYKVEGNRDRFANINYRITPALGVGYWFSDTPDYKAMVEAAVGYEHTTFRDSTKTSDEAILAPRGFFEKKLIGQLTIAQDLSLYPSLTEEGEYRFVSQTDLTNPINENTSLRISFIDEYDSNPPGQTEKNDFRVTSSIVHSF